VQLKQKRNDSLKEKRKEEMGYESCFNLARRNCANSTGSKICHGDVTSKARCLAQDWKEFLGSEEDRNTKHDKMVTDSIRGNLIQTLYFLASSRVLHPMIHTLTPGTSWQTVGFVRAKEGAVRVLLRSLFLYQIMLV
jgi:hypothetical protein